MGADKQVSAPSKDTMNKGQAGPQTSMYPGPGCSGRRMDPFDDLTQPMRPYEDCCPTQAWPRECCWPCDCCRRPEWCGPRDSYDPRETYDPRASWGQREAWAPRDAHMHRECHPQRDWHQQRECHPRRDWYWPQRPQMTQSRTMMPLPDSFFGPGGFWDSDSRPMMPEPMRRRSHGGMPRWAGPSFVSSHGWGAPLVPFQHGFELGNFSQPQYVVDGGQVSRSTETQNDMQYAHRMTQQTRPGGRWVTETMEGVWDGEAEPIMKKTRASFDTEKGILRRETQRRIGERSSNVVKTKKVSHPSELSEEMSWDTETRSRPKSDSFDSQWKEAKKSLTPGPTRPQHPAAPTHPVLFQVTQSQTPAQKK